MSYREQLEPLRPSAKLAYKTLRHDEPLTQQDIIEETYNLDRRTVQRALESLEDADLIYKEHCTQDNRQDLYYIAQE